MAVAQLTNGAQYEAALREEALQCLYFTAAWCGPCQRVAPGIAALAAQHHPLIAFSKIDVDTAELAAAIHSEDVVSVPMFVFKKGGQTVHTVTGANLAEITSFCATAAAAAAQKIGGAEGQQPQDASDEE